MSGRDIPPPAHRHLRGGSAAWVALFDPDDRHHPAAARLWSRLRGERRRLLTTECVVDETYTLLRREALRLMLACRDRVLSFTDCTRFALLRRRKVCEVFTFDGDFERAGFVVRPGAAG